MRIIGFGDLVIDYYYFNNNLFGVVGGGSVSNILCNLAAFGLDSNIIGACGNDEEGQIAIRSLNKVGINTDDINIRKTKTRAFHISIKEDKEDIEKNEIISRMACPNCNNRRWYSSSKIPTILPTKYKTDKDNIIIFDNLNIANMNIVEQARESGLECIVDIGHIANLKYMRRDELLAKLANKFSLVQLNGTVADFFVKRFQLNGCDELINIFNSKLIIITRGKNGAAFAFKDGKEIKYYNKELKSFAKEVDSTGAGDAFFAKIIKCYIENDRVIDEDIINKMFAQATELAAEVVSNIGARSHLMRMEVKHATGEGCVCDAKEVVKSKSVRKKVSTNIKNLEDRVLRALESEAYGEINVLLENFKNSVVYLIGAGGSYSTAYFASRVINHTTGIVTKVLKPRELLYDRLDMVDCFIFFSYSGLSSDILQLVNSNIIKHGNKIIITKGDIKKISLKVTNNNTHVISYRNSEFKAGRERGFLSFEGTVAPSSLFGKYYYSTKFFGGTFEDWFTNRIEFWANYFESFFKESIMKYNEIFANKGVFDVFCGDYSSTAAYDIESKLVESGKYRVTCHEKKNFSHGRFITIEHLSTNLIIYYRCQDISSYEKKLLNYLYKRNENILEIRSDYNGIMAEFDLLIATQFFIADLGKFINSDLSNPEYSDESMVLYRYKGKL